MKGGCGGVNFYALENIDKNTDIRIHYGGTSGEDYKAWFTGRIIYHDA